MKDGGSIQLYAARHHFAPVIGVLSRRIPSRRGGGHSPTRVAMKDGGSIQLYAARHHFAPVIGVLSRRIPSREGGHRLGGGSR